MKISKQSRWVKAAYGPDFTARRRTGWDEHGNPIYGPIRTTLCKLFWAAVWNVTKLVGAVAIVGVTILSVLALIGMAWWKLAANIGGWYPMIGWTLLVAVAFTLIYFTPRYTSRAAGDFVASIMEAPMEKLLEVRTKTRESVLWQMVLAAKSKVCPVIEIGE